MARPQFIKIELPVVPGLDGFRISDDGSLTFLDREGQSVHVDGVVRTVMHERPGKGPKIRSQQWLRGTTRVSLDGLDELCKYDDVFVLDTAYHRYPLRRCRAVCCALRLRFVAEDQGVRVLADDRLTVYDLLDYEENPERAGILALANDLAFGVGGQAMHRAVVTDSDLGQHEAINRRELPIYANSALPTPFTLHYAGDIGSETLNRVLRFCDVQSKSLWKDLLSGNAPTPGSYTQLANSGTLKIGKLQRTDVQTVNNLVPRASGFPGSASVTFHGDDGREETHQLSFPPGARSDKRE